MRLSWTVHKFCQLLGAVLLLGQGLGPVYSFGESVAGLEDSEYTPQYVSNNFVKQPSMNLSRNTNRFYGEQPSRAECLDGSCDVNTLGSRTDLTLPLHGYGLPCAQKALLAAAKKIAPHRRISGGHCGPGVQKIITEVERTHNGFGQAPIPKDFRYPKNFIGWLEDRDWIRLPIQNESQAPPGAVIIFRGPGPFSTHGDTGYTLGHITIKGDDHLWYTDGRTEHAAGRSRYFVAAFIPGPKQNASCGE